MRSKNAANPESITYRTIQSGDDETVRALYKLVQTSHAQEVGTQAVIDFVRSHINEVFDEDLAEPYVYFTLPGQGCWLAQVGNHLVGMACIERWPGEDDIARLRHVMVDPNWRQSGIASTILGNAETWCIDHRYRAIRLITTEINAVALDIYRRRGYIEFERKPGMATMTYTMEKPLPPHTP